MVDALRAVHAPLRRGGTLLDVRPTHWREPRVEVGGRVVGRLRAGDLGDDLAADAAAARLVAEGLFRPVRSGHFWHRFSFGGRREFDDWRLSTRRFPRYTGAPLGRGAITVRRAVVYHEYLRL